MDRQTDEPTGVGDVFLLDPGRPASTINAHDVASLHGIGYRLARLLGGRFLSWYRHGADALTPPYYIPADTLVGSDALPACAAGVPAFFGGQVPHAFVASKVVVHPLPGRSAAAPAGWSHDLAVEIEDVVLPGFSVFDVNDAITAVRQLLRQGPVRLKPAWTRGGEGQVVIGDVAQAQQAIAALDADDLSAHGIVVEQNLCDPVTYSVGEVRCAGITAAYVGRQRQTCNREGAQVYGGSDLMVLRGDLADLERSVQAPGLAQAIRQARLFDAAVAEAYPGFCASRRNYDLIEGTTADGRHVAGVLEQSWRVGGATPAEIAALAAFAADGNCVQVRASSHEVYGAAVLPDNADIYYRGVDPVEGLLTKYSVVEHGRSSPAM